MPSRFRDAYPYPTNDERPRDVWPTRPSDAELWDAMTAADVDAVSDAGELGTIPQASAVHYHQLCGHDCRSGACNGLEAICQSCEWRLQDSRTSHRSRGMNRRD